MSLNYLLRDTAYHNLSLLAICVNLKLLSGSNIMSFNLDDNLQSKLYITHFLIKGSDVLTKINWFNYRTAFYVWLINTVNTH